LDEILKQILSELKNLRQGQTELRQGQETLISRVGNLEKGQLETNKKLTKLAVHVEGEITDKIRGLYDARELMLDSLARIEARLDRQDERLDHQETLTLNKKRR